MKQKQRDEDARVWASSIGSTTIDIVDRKAPNATHRPLRAPLVPTDKLAELRRLMEGKQ